MGVRSAVLSAHYRICVRFVRVAHRKIREPLPQAKRKSAPSGAEMERSALPRNVSKIKKAGSVPQTDSGGQVEKTKANE